MSPLEIRYTQAKTDLNALKVSSPKNTTSIDTLLVHNENLYKHSTDFTSSALTHITSASGCASVSDQASNLVKSIISTMSSLINATGLNHIFDAIGSLINLTGQTLTNSINEVAKLLTDAINSVLEKIDSLAAIKELSSAVSGMLTSITGIVSCAGDALLKNTSTDVGALIGHIDPSKSVLFNHIKSENDAGKKFGEIRESSKAVISSHLDVPGKMNSAISTFGSGF